MRKLILLAMMLFAFPAQAGISLTLSNQNLAQSSSPLTCALTGTTAGRLVIVAQTNTTNLRTMTSTADTNGNTWVEFVDAAGYGIVASTLTTGGNTTVSITLSGTSGAGAHAQCFEFSSTTGWPASASLLDQTGAGSGSGVQAANISPGMTITQAEELIFGLHSLSAARTVTAGADFDDGAGTLAGALAGSWEPASQTIHNVYAVTSATGTYSVPITWTSSSNFVSKAASIKNTATAATAVKHRVIIQ